MTSVKSWVDLIMSVCHIAYTSIISFWFCTRLFSSRIFFFVKGILLISVQPNWRFFLFYFKIILTASSQKKILEVLASLLVLYHVQTTYSNIYCYITIWTTVSLDFASICSLANFNIFITTTPAVNFAHKCHIAV